MHSSTYTNAHLSIMKQAHNPEWLWPHGYKTELDGELYATTRYSFTHMDITWQTPPIDSSVCSLGVEQSVSWYF